MFIFDNKNPKKLRVLIGFSITILGFIPLFLILIYLDKNPNILGSISVIWYLVIIIVFFLYLRFLFYLSKIIKTKLFKLKESRSYY